MWTAPKLSFSDSPQQNVASNMLISLSGSFQTSPSFWIDPKTGTQYNVVAQTPQFRLSSLNDLGNTPLSQSVGSVPAADGTSQILSNVSHHAPQRGSRRRQPLQRPSGFRHLR